MKTEKEKMLGGELYDCGDPELLEIWQEAKKLMVAYNGTAYDDKESQGKILRELLGSMGDNLQITAPFYVDFGKFIHLGNNCEINLNCVFLDGNQIIIGDDAMIAPGVHIYTVFHPVKAADRFASRHKGPGFPYAISQTAPVKIGNRVWIGGGSLIMPGVTIGDNVTIGAGSLVTKSLPSNVLAYGNPCRIIRDL